MNWRKMGVDAHRVGHGSGRRIAALPIFQRSGGGGGDQTRNLIRVGNRFQADPLPSGNSPGEGYLGEYPRCQVP